MPARAQSETPLSIDSAIGVTQFAGENASDQPDVVVDVTAAMKLGGGWVAYVRPWFRRAGSEPHTFSREIYQAALQARGRLPRHIPSAAR